MLVNLEDLGDRLLRTSGQRGILRRHSVHRVEVSTGGVFWPGAQVELLVGGVVDEEASEGAVRPRELAFEARRAGLTSLLYIHKH